MRVVFSRYIGYLALYMSSFVYIALSYIFRYIEQLRIYTIDFSDAFCGICYAGNSKSSK